MLPPCYYCGLAIASLTVLQSGASLFQTDRSEARKEGWKKGWKKGGREGRKEYGQEEALC